MMTDPRSDALAQLGIFFRPVGASLLAAGLAIAAAVLADPTQLATFGITPQRAVVIIVVLQAFQAFSKRMVGSHGDRIAQDVGHAVADGAEPAAAIAFAVEARAPDKAAQVAAACPVLPTPATHAP